MATISGIYAICNHRTGEAYIGHSRDIARRWATHYAALVIARHSNRALQAAWDRDAAAFGLVILERVPVVEQTGGLFWFDLARPRMELERSWLTRARAAGITLYNDRVRCGGRRRAA